MGFVVAPPFFDGRVCKDSAHNPNPLVHNNAKLIVYKFIINDLFYNYFDVDIEESRPHRLH